MDCRMCQLGRSIPQSRGRVPALSTAVAAPSTWMARSFPAEIEPPGATLIDDPVPELRNIPKLPPNTEPRTLTSALLR